MNPRLNQLVEQLSAAFTQEAPPSAANERTGSDGDSTSMGSWSSPACGPNLKAEAPHDTPLREGTVTSDPADPGAELLDRGRFTGAGATGAVRLADYARVGYHVEATVLPGEVVRAAGMLDQAGFALDTITGVDWLASEEMEIVYDYFHPTTTCRVVIRARVPRSHPEVPTIAEVFPGANWHERETHDFFGIRFLGHPDLTPFLLPEDADYHPLRKDFGL